MIPSSEHAPAERASWETLHEQLSIVNLNTVLQETVMELDACILLLNAHRQIVYVNSASRNMLCETEDPATLYGCRPGEAMHCVHAKFGDGGCGTTRFCRVCGAVNAVLTSLQGSPDAKRCRINREGEDEPFDCIVFSMPVHLEGATYALVSITEAPADETPNDLAKHAFSMRGLAARIEQSQGRDI